MSIWLTAMHEKAWIPAFAGMTPRVAPGESGGPLRSSRRGWVAPAIRCVTPAKAGVQ
jgi:hypothetical protein